MNFFYRINFWRKIKEGIEYAVNMGIGEQLFETGGITLVMGVLLRLIAGIVSKRRK